MQGKQVNQTQITTSSKTGTTVHTGTKSARVNESSTTDGKNSGSNTQKSQGGFLQGCLGCLGILVLLAVVLIVALALLGDDDSERRNNSVNTTLVQTDDTTALTGIDEQISSTITNAIGVETNTGEPRIIDLQVNDHAGTQKDGDKIVIASLHANDNLTEKMIKGGMQLEATYVFKELFEIAEIEEVTIKWEFPMVDQYGNSELKQVMKINLNKETASKINWEGFDKNNFKIVANSYWEHPSIRSE